MASLETDIVARPISVIQFKNRSGMKAHFENTISGLGVFRSFFLSTFCGGGGGGQNRPAWLCSSCRGVFYMTGSHSE